MAETKGTPVAGPLVAGLFIAVAASLWLGPLIGVVAGLGIAGLLLLVVIAQKGGAQ